MSAQKNLQNLENLLKNHNQSHLLAFWQQINPHQRQNLLTQIQALDFVKIDKFISSYIKTPASACIPADFTPARSYSHVPTDAQQRRKYRRAKQLGQELISSGAVAAFVVAGGQGTRLGYNGPKGNFKITPINRKTLFQVFAESVTAASGKYQATCPWYIMTSAMNHDETLETFRANDYYGLNEKDVFIFQQGTLPNFDFEGRILLADKATIACSPDGHGGSIKALYNSGAIEDMKARGVKCVSYFQVDNPLINVFDPLFIGLHALDEAEMSSKAVTKTGPLERVGNFCIVDGKVTVIEYSDLPEAIAKKRNPDGTLAFGLGSIAVHIINTGFIEKLNKKGFALPLHKAVKKIPHIDSKGQLVQPDKPNGIKLETFIFDALPLASKSIILQTTREEEFAPVKNAAGADSPEVAQKMMITRAAKWLETAGIQVPNKPDGSVDATIEIAPGFALEKDDIKAKLNQIPPIKPGDKVYLK